MSTRNRADSRTKDRSRSPTGARKNRTRHRSQADTAPAVEQWQSLLDQRDAVAKTLVVNISSLREFMLHPEFDKHTDAEMATNIAKALKQCAVTFTDRLHGLSSAHANKHGDVDSESTQDYAYMWQQYISLHEDIVGVMSGIATLMVQLQQKICDIIDVNPEADTHA